MATTFCFRIPSRIFVMQFWAICPPPFVEEFDEWMTETFGEYNKIYNIATGFTGVYRCKDRWSAYPISKSVRSTGGTGNRGGWEEHPAKMEFVFYNDADAIVFKMKYQGQFIEE
jgi:hypothetical protein